MNESPRQLAYRQLVAASFVAGGAHEMRLDVGEAGSGTENATHITALYVTVASAARAPTEEHVPLREEIKARIEGVVAGASAALADGITDVGRGRQVDATPIFHQCSARTEAASRGRCLSTSTKRQ